MKPLELSSVSEVWKLAIGHIEKALEPFGRDVQIWFPWGTAWRGHDLRGTLPPTDLPESLTENPGEKFAGRTWFPVHVLGRRWLVSLHRQSQSAKVEGEPEIAASPDFPESARNTLNLLGEFVRMEGLLGLAIRILETCAHERNGHWERVRNLCVAVGRRLQLPPHDLFELEVAAMLHDIGKTALPAALLGESRPLSPGERKQIESHSTIGAAMIREIPGMERIAEYVLHHHESPDGKGYPKGLRGEEIPLAALILSAADTFDAMTHYRPYASEHTYQETIREMIAHSGRFDDRVLWALGDVLRAIGILDVHPGFDRPDKPQEQSSDH